MPCGLRRTKSSWLTARLNKQRWVQLQCHGTAAVLDQSATISILSNLSPMQAWPSLVTGPLGHLWEAGLDPLDPLFLANIQDPSPRHPVRWVPPLRHQQQCSIW